MPVVRRTNFVPYIRALYTFNYIIIFTIQQLHKGGHIPILQMRRMRLSKGKSLAPGPAGRFESGQSDSGPQDCTTWLCSWLRGGILLYDFPSAPLIV